MSVKIEIITCPQWKARHPKHTLQTVGMSNKIIIHHTAGHHREISNPSNESKEEAMRYARDIQAFHMAPGGLGAASGGSDSGHNFLVSRAGHILQGRWLTVSAIQARHMVASAHCPGQNNQIGIEHEHLGNEEFTDAQFQASARLIAWISYKYGLPKPLPLMPHRKYFPTSCPANLADDIPRLYKRAQAILAGT